MNGQRGLCAQSLVVTVQKKEREFVWKDLVQAHYMKVLNAKLMDVSYSLGSFISDIETSNRL